MHLSVINFDIMIHVFNHSREECSWQDAHELLNSSVELLEVPGEYLKKTDSNNSRIVSKVTLVIQWNYPIRVSDNP